MGKKNIDIDYLIDIVSQGGAIRTGVDVRNKSGALLIQRNVRITNVNHLLVLKNNGLRIDRRHALKSPIDVYDYLPDFLKQTVKPAA